MGAEESSRVAVMTTVMTTSASFRLTNMHFQKRFRCDRMGAAEGAETLISATTIGRSRPVSRVRKEVTLCDKLHKA